MRWPRRYTVGDPFAEGTRLGPLISEVQRDRVRSYIEKGIEEGATLVTGGADAPEGLETGFFVQPTVFSNVTTDMTIAQEEIFGPVLSIIPYDTEDEAVEIANDTLYGLAGAVSGQRRARQGGGAQAPRRPGERSTRRRTSAAAPFGGYKQSGLGREHGEYGLEEFLEVKALFESPAPERKQELSRSGAPGAVEVPIDLLDELVAKGPAQEVGG